MLLYAYRRYSIRHLISYVDVYIYIYTCSNIFIYMYIVCIINNASHCGEVHCALVDQRFPFVDYVLESFFGRVILVLCSKKARRYDTM